MSPRQAKKLLIVSTAFYPDSVVQAIRLTHWCKHLPEFGWKPTVLCRPYGNQAQPDQLARDLHPDVEVHYLGKPSPISPNTGVAQAGQLQRRLKKLAASAVRGLVVPDHSMPFWRSARETVGAFADRLRPDVILTSSPPHSNHDIGMWLSQGRPKLPWVADFRDPYLLDPRFGAHGKWRALFLAHARYERRIYEQASLVTHAIPAHARWSRLHYPEFKQKIRLLTNGFPAELAAQERTLPRATNLRMHFVSMGNHASEERLTLAHALAAIRKTHPDLKWQHLGRLEPVDEAISQLLGDAHSVTGLLSHNEAMAVASQADVLVGTLKFSQSLGVGLSSKLFEFLATGKPFVMINPTRADRLLLKRYVGYRTLTRPQVPELTDALRWTLSDQAQPPDSQVLEVKQQFSRRIQAQQLAEWLDELV